MVFNTNSHSFIFGSRPVLTSTECLATDRAYVAIHGSPFCDACFLQQGNCSRRSQFEEFERVLYRFRIGNWMNKGHDSSMLMKKMKTCKGYTSAFSHSSRVTQMNGIFSHSETGKDPDHIG